MFVSGAFGVIGSLFPYVLPPRTWAAAKEIEKMRIDGYKDGWGVSYNVAF